jgi:hypothetical protein
MSVLAESRRVARAKIAKAARRLTKSDVLHGLRAATKHAAKRFRKIPGGAEYAAAAPRALQRVGRQLDRVLACRPSPADLFAGKHCRALCTALRRLRDMLEVSLRAWQCDVHDMLATVNRLLLLSEKQRDCKAAGKCLAKLMAKDPPRERPGCKGPAYAKTAAGKALLYTMEEQHRRCCRKLAATWQGLDRRQFWQALRGALDAGPKDVASNMPVAAASTLIAPALSEAKNPAGKQLATSRPPLPAAPQTASEALVTSADDGQLAEWKRWFGGRSDEIGATDRLRPPTGLEALPGTARPVVDHGLPMGIESGPGLLLWPYENGESPVGRYCNPPLHSTGAGDLASGATLSCPNTLVFPPSADMVIEYSRQFYQFLPLNRSDSGDWEMLRQYLREGIGKRCTLFYLHDAHADFQALRRTFNPSAIAG